MKRGLVLDSWALLAWLNDEEPAASAVERLLERAEKKQTSLAMSMINLGEIYYVIARSKSFAEAELTRERLLSSPVAFHPVDNDLVFEAARIKAQHALSYADAFAAALAFRLDAFLVTGDPEFGSLQKKDKLSIHWLGRST